MEEDERPPKKIKLDEVEENSQSSSENSGYIGAHRADGGSDFMIQEQDLSEQYQLLDEVTEENDDEYEAEGEDGDEQRSPLSDDSSLEDFDVDYIDAMLDEELKRKQDDKQKRTEDDVGVEIEKRFLIDVNKMSSPYHALPDDWLRIIHKSGMPLYLNKKTRVCCASRPYFIGNISFRNHDIPICAIPCLQYRKIRDSTEKDANNTEDNNEASETLQCSENSTASETKQRDESTTSSKSCPFDSKSGENIGIDSSEANKLNDKEQVENGKSVEMTDERDLQKNNLSISVVSSENKELNNSVTDGTESKNHNNKNEEFLNSTCNESNDTKMNVDKESDNTELSKEKESGGNNNGESCQTNTQSSTFNTALAEALNIYQKPIPSAATLLPSNDAKICFEEQEPHVLTVDQFIEYCSKLFEFEVKKKIKFQYWNTRRKHWTLLKKQKLLGEQDDSNTTQGTKLLAIKTKNNVDLLSSRKKRWMLNPKGKGIVSILHEYVQFVFKSQPEYVYKAMENSTSPYAAAIKINGMEYATGFGSSKRQAKAEAAKATLAIVMPEVVEKLDAEFSKNTSDDLKFFDKISIEDPSVSELCVKMSELPPYSLLLNCLKRNNCLENTGVKLQMVNKPNQKNEFTMSTGRHTVTVMCKNKKEGKQKAAQALLQKLHPHIDSWGSMLRLYGNDTIRELKQKKKDEQEVTLLQNNAAANQPNFSIINMLKQEMLKLSQKRKAIQPLGEFKPPEDICLPTPSSSDLNTLDL